MKASCLFFVVACLLVQLLNSNWAAAGELADFYAYVTTRDAKSDSASGLISQAMEARVAARRSELYPKISLLATEVRRKQEVSNIGSSFIRTGEISFDNSRHMALLRQPIFNPELNAKLEVAKIQQQSAQLELEIEQLEQLNHFFKDYIQAALHKDLSNSFDRTIKQLDQILSSAERKFELKLVKLHELSTIRLHTLDLKKDARSNSAEFADLFEKLSLAQTTDNTLTINVLNADLSGFLGSSNLEHENHSAPDPEIVSLRSDISLLEQEIESERAKRWPTLSAVALYEFDDGAESIFGDSTRVRNYEIGLQFEWALFEGGRGKHAIREAAFLKNAKLAALKQRQSERKMEYGQLRTSLQRATQALVDEREILGFRKTVRDAMEKGYEAGTETLLSTVDAIVLYEESVRQFDISRYQSLINFIELTSFSGGLKYADAQAIDALFEQ